MKVTLPQGVVGDPGTVFLVKVEFPVSTAERQVRIDTEGPVESLDAAGQQPCDTFQVQVGLDLLHIPMRVTEKGTGHAKVGVRCTAGPEEGEAFSQTLELTAPAKVERSGSGAKIAVVGVLVAALAAGAFFLGGPLGLFGGTKVPDRLAGKKLADAKVLLADNSIKYEVQYEETDDEKFVGHVLRTDPAGGDSIAEGDVLKLYVGQIENKFPMVADLRGEQADVAERTLKAQGFQVMIERQPVSDASRVGSVVSMSPAGGKPIDKRQPIILYEGALESDPATPGHSAMGNAMGNGMGTLPEPGSAGGTDPDGADPMGADPMGADPLRADPMDTEPDPQPTEAGPARSTQYAAAGFAVYEVEGRLWVFKEGSEALATFLEVGEPAKSVTLIGEGPDNKTLRGAERSVLAAYGAAMGLSAPAAPDGTGPSAVPSGTGPSGSMPARPSRSAQFSRGPFVAYEADGDLWVFRDGSLAQTDFVANGAPDRQINLPSAGPEGMTVRGVDRQVLEAYIKLWGGELPTDPGNVAAPSGSNTPGTRPAVTSGFPDLVGMRHEEADRAITAFDATLFASIDYAPASDSSMVDRVIRQTPKPGTAKGSFQDVTLVLGTEPVPGAGVSSVPPRRGGTTGATGPGETGGTPGSTDPMDPNPGTSDPGPGTAATNPDETNPWADPSGEGSTASTPRGADTGTTDPTSGNQVPPALPPGPNGAGAIPIPGVARPDATDIDVPDVVGTQRFSAEGRLRRAGLRSRIRFETTEDLEEGMVISQTPAAGERVKSTVVVELLVARRPAARGVGVPNVVGEQRDEAETRLREAGFLVRVTFTGSRDYPVGTVSAQAPRAGSSAGPRTWVEIVVVQGRSGPQTQPSEGEPGFPGTGGTDRPATGETLDPNVRPPAVGPGRSVRPPPTPRATTKPNIDLDPTAPASESVPGVSGTDARAAIEAILKARLVPIVQVGGEGSAGRVTRQRPTSGSARPGDLVRLYVASGAPADAAMTNLPVTIGTESEAAKRMLAGRGIAADVRVIDAPGHPYAGTKRVAAQFPTRVDSRSRGQRVTIWVIR